MRNTVYITILILGVISSAGCGDKIKPGEHKVERPEVRGVTLQEVKLEDGMEFYRTTGTVQSKNTAVVSAKIVGEVIETKVTAGDLVKKGDVLLTISSPDLKAKVSAAKETVEEEKKRLSIAAENKKLAVTTSDRYRKLYEEKAITGQEFDEITTKLEVANLEYARAGTSLKRAEAGLNEAEAFDSYSMIKSPVTGIVTEKKIDKGSMTAPGAALFIIEEPGYRVEVAVDESLFSYIKIGLSADVAFGSSDTIIKGKVGEIDQHIDPMTRTFVIKIDITPDRRALRGGLYAAVSFPAARISELLVPVDAVITRGELRAVYVVDQNNIILLRLVKTGNRKGEYIEVLSGLDAGERIVVQGIEKAVDGGLLAGK